MALRYIYHKSFNVNSSSARIRKPVVSEHEQRLLALQSRVKAIKAKSNVGPNGKPNLTKV